MRGSRCGGRCGVALPSQAVVQEESTTTAFDGAFPTIHLRNPPRSIRSLALLQYGQQAGQQYSPPIHNSVPYYSSTPTYPVPPTQQVAPYLQEPYCRYAQSLSAPGRAMERPNLTASRALERPEKKGTQAGERRSAKEAASVPDLLLCHTKLILVLRFNWVAPGEGG